MANKVPWKIGMLIYLPVTSQPFISLQKEAVLSPCNFATTHLTACILNLYLPLTSRPMKRRTLSQRPIIFCALPFESKLLPAVLLFLRINFPEITVTVTVLKFGGIHLVTITVTVLASTVTPSFPLIPNYHLESYLNYFSRNYHYRYCLEIFLN